MSDFSPCFLIPCYNHGDTVAKVTQSLKAFSYPIILVNDGSDQYTSSALNELAKQDDIHLVTLRKNQGKGGAVIAGIHHANSLNFTHAIQIDADGQHDVNALPELISAAKSSPDSLVSGQPIYDESIPKSRLYGRYITHFWVWVETLSFSIKDTMCGFRAYPVSQTVKVLDQYRIGLRMDFDTEIMVRMYWEGCEIEFVDTQVVYPEGGISHFDALWDNIYISKMHTKLFFGMLLRSPKLLMRTIRSNKNSSSDSAHWSKRKEQGTVLGIKTLLAVYSLLGRRVFNLFLYPVIGYYFLVGRQAKQASNHYLQQLAQHASQNNIQLPNKLTRFQHLFSFGQTMLDKLAAWKGDYSFDNLSIYGQDDAQSLIDNKQGALLIGSHLGNIELCRALSRHYTDLKINALVFTEHAQQFNSVLNAINPDSNLNLIQVSSIGPDTAILLQQKLEQGEWIVIVGDRTSTSKESRSIWAEFLSKPAPFPQGPFMLASVLKAPVYLLFGLRDEQSKSDHFEVYFEHFSDRLEFPRHERQEALTQTVQKYATRLEHYTLKAPLQWYNFFNFWTLSQTQQDNKDD
ncbi:acyltransferase [Vibrio sp. MACH09]|uniref:glycosyltransferase family 2 protein n=1 Tax=Vibrio sp. MACH09 TaxID=3025122 RepID=UPI0027925847|nr:glycosyltransferase family 2 protein [Vibrio sp. MACH09]GLO61997.1 acyltransferase [Vibrio sp. MACH09]